MPERSALIDSLIAKAAKRVFLDIGAAMDNAPGWTRMDTRPGPGVDVVHNVLDFPWPFDDASVFHIRAYHLLERIPHLCACSGQQLDPLLQTFEEFWRILLPGGTVQAISAHSSNHQRAWTDPRNCRGINEGSFVFANVAGRQTQDAVGLAMQSDFVLKWGYIHSNEGEVLELQMELSKPDNRNGDS